MKTSAAPSAVSPTFTPSIAASTLAEWIPTKRFGMWWESFRPEDNLVLCVTTSEGPLSWSLSARRNSRCWWKTVLAGEGTLPTLRQAKQVRLMGLGL